MEVIYFGSGILAVALAYAVAGVFKLKERVDILKTRGRDLSDTVFSNDEKINQRVSDEINDVYRALDSRLDKLESRLSK